MENELQKVINKGNMQFSVNQPTVEGNLLVPPPLHLPSFLIGVAW
jgi:hypothetical protein